MDLDIVYEGLNMVWYRKVVAKDGMSRTRMCISIPDRSEVHGQLDSANLTKKKMSENIMWVKFSLTFSLQLMAGSHAGTPPVRMDGRTQSLSQECLFLYSIVVHPGSRK